MSNCWHLSSINYHRSFHKRVNNLAYLVLVPTWLHLYYSCVRGSAIELVRNALSNKTCKFGYEVIIYHTCCFYYYSMRLFYHTIKVTFLV